MKNSLALGKILKKLAKIKKMKPFSAEVAFPIILVMFGLISIFFLDSSSEKSLEKTTQSIIESVERCFKYSENQVRTKCYDEAASGYLASHTPEELLSEFKLAMEQNGDVRKDCHQIAHAMGRATLIKLGSIAEVFQLDRNLDTCAGGFFHGAIEKIFRPDNDTPAEEHINLTEFKKKIPTLCDQFEKNDRKSECIHGIGHGVMYLMADLQKSLDSCALIPKVSDRFSCHSGVFMEYHISGRSKADNKKNPQFPCSSMNDSLKNPCYYVQSFRLNDLKLSKEEIIKECRKAGNPAGGFCVRGYGIFFLAHEALAEGPEKIVEFCESLDRANARVCAESVASRLASHTETGQYAMPFCSLFISDYTRERCFAYTIDVLRLGHKIDAKLVAEDCKKYASNPDECLKEIDK